MPIKEKIANTFVSAILNSNGAADENRTHTGIPIRPSNVRVYQFRHDRIYAI